MPPTILLVQADPLGAQATQAVMAQASDAEFRVEWVSSCEMAIERLASVSMPLEPRIAVLLLELARSDEPALKEFDEIQRAAPQVPILILAGDHEVPMAKLAVQRGAQDFILKSRIDGYSLPKAVSGILERAANAEALFEEKERAQVTLNSIGDAVVSTDVAGVVTYLNLVAEELTGWSRQDAAGRPLEEVFRIIDASTRSTVRNPMLLAIRENKAVGLTPNCVLIQRNGEESAIEDSAAPIHDRLGRVTGAVMVFHDVSTARAMSQKMAYLAQHDALTDLPNRILLNDRLTQAIAIACRHQHPLGLLFLDVDRFKHVNDSLGHGIGDRLLQSVAQRLLACTRTTDTVSRQGGDEFVILLSEVSQSVGVAISSEKIMRAMIAPHRIDQHDVHATVSIGIATYPGDGEDAQTLLKNAEVAMYQAKDSGRNNYQFFRADMHERAIERRSIDSGLRKALEENQFVLHYQPKVNLQSGRITGTEALVRWLSPWRGCVAPAHFIPTAEENGSIVSIGQWVLREACRQSRAWQDEGLPRLCMAVNISAVELRARDFLAAVGLTLAETGHAADQLELEITETFLMQDSPATSNVLRGLKDMGIRLALDDFGTGYSSLSYLKRFPIDTLKIDQSFVQDLATDPDDASIVSAVISMGKSLHMRVVAEGVETRQQLAFLQRHSCHDGQGYYFSEALMPEPFSQFMRRNASQVDPWALPGGFGEKPAMHSPGVSSARP